MTTRQETYSVKFMTYLMLHERREHLLEMGYEPYQGTVKNFTDAMAEGFPKLSEEEDQQAAMMLKLGSAS